MRALLSSRTWSAAPLALAIAGSPLPGCKKAAREPLRVAAASDLSTAFVEVGRAFERDGGRRVDFTFGSSGLLARQVAEGAPFDVFAAANVSFVDDVVRSSVCLGESKQTYARGRIVVWASDPKMLPRALGDLANPRYAKVAIANPEHAPYGRAAKEALTQAGLWAAVEPRAVYGENVQQTLAFARSGNAEVAIVALSLVVGDTERILAVDEALHAPLEQALVVCKGGVSGPKLDDGRAFAAFVGSQRGRTIMERHGFVLP